MRRGRLAVVAGLVVSGVLFAAAAGAVTFWDVEAELDPPESADLYGRSVAVDSDTLAVGAPADDVRFADSGAAWVYARNPDGEWVRQAKLHPANAAAGDLFGYGVDVDGNLLVVGAPEAGLGGRTYIFSRVGSVWSQQAALNSVPVVTDSRAGETVAIDGQLVAIGAPERGGGAVFIHERQLDGTWTQVDTLVPPDVGEADRFGGAVALSGSTLVVGSARHDGGGGDSGAVYVFERESDGSWSQQAKILPIGGAAGDLFGQSVAIDQNTIVAGARGDDTGGSGAGSAFVFTRSGSTWSQQAELTGDGAGSLAGSAVGVDGDRLAVGASGSGSVQIYEVVPDGFELVERIEGQVLFGSRLSLWSEILAVATDSPSSGNVTVFKREVVPEPPVPVGMFDPARAEWHISDGAGTTNSFAYGLRTDIPVFGDWDCDGTETVGMFRPSNGFWYLRNSNDLGFADLEFWFGLGGDLPIAGDWNGDGCDTVGIYRNGVVYQRDSLTTGVADRTFFYGVPTDDPFAGDFDGDGIDTVGLYRRSAGLVFFRNSNSSGFADAQFFYGIPGDQIVAADWDADGDDTVGIFRPSESRFYISNENSQRVADFDFRFGSFDWIAVG